MTKCVCDICKENEPNKKFKVKQNKHMWRNGYYWSGWGRIDICEDCYLKLISLTDNDFDNIVNKYINKDK